MKVTLRQREKATQISLYLDYYDRGKRWNEYLKLFLYPEPGKGKLTKIQKEHNKQTLALAETIRSKRQLEIQNGVYGFQDQTKLKASFLKYIELLMDQRENSKGNYGNWDSTLKHLKKFSSKDILFEDINTKWLESFKQYLIKEARTKSNNPLSQNSQHSYFNKVRAALKQAVRDGILNRNPAEQVEGIKQGDTQREFLTHEELQAAAKANCDIPIMKTAFLFSALTGLRWSDVQKLSWSEVQYSEENGWYIRFRQKKTKGAETLPISDQARQLLGEIVDDEERVFKGLKYSAWHNMRLKQWMMRAGISKTITFHCARHTYATLLLTKGADIFTVSKLLGHKDLKTTQVYAKIIDQKKREAANKIQIEL